MKLYQFLVAVSLLIMLNVSCHSFEDNTVPHYVVDTSKVDGAAPEIFEFQGHQYVRFGVGQNSWGAHLANCNNPVHRHIHIYPEYDSILHK